MPPFNRATAKRHNHKAKSAKSQDAFAAAATSVYGRTHDEGRAIRAGNVAANRSNAKTKRRGK